MVDAFFTIKDYMKTILSLLSKIKYMSDDEKIKLSYNVRDVVIYNFTIFQNKKLIELENLVEKYGT